MGSRWWLTQRTVSIGTSLALIFVLVVLVAVGATQWAMRYQEDVSVRAMAETQARRTAELVFQNLYSVMSRGWTRDDLLDIIERINAVEPEVAIRVHRSAAVAKQFGDVPASRAARENDPMVATVLETGVEALERDEAFVRFVYPLIGTGECLGCHAVDGVAATSAGVVKGVIDMRFPTSELRIPLQFSLRLALYALMATLAALFLLIFLQMRVLIVRPIIDLATVIRGVMESDDLGRRIAVRRFWPREIRQLSGSFNSLMKEVEENRGELVEQSLRDPLTGLFNRRRFDAALARELDRARRYPRPLSVLLIDLDGFKPINDIHGHAAGDRVLGHVARLLRANVRGTDVVARIGGDEFAILLPETDEPEAAEVIVKLSAAIADDPARWNGADLPVGASIGAATCPGICGSAADLLAAADAAMYAEKTARRAGRDGARGLGPAQPANV